jgi:hypothetical protein
LTGGKPVIRATRPNFAAALLVAVGVGLILVGLYFEVVVGADLRLPGLLPLGVGTFFVCLGGWLLVSARRYAQLVRRLAVRSVQTTGTVIDNDARELWVGGNLQRKLRYEYTDHAGIKHTGLSDWMPRSAALRSKPQTTGLVRYDPERPQDSEWIREGSPPAR